MSREENKLKAITGINKRYRKTMTILIVILLVMGMIFWKGYKGATEKYKDIIREKEDIISELQNEIAVYVSTNKEIDLALINSEIYEIGELATIEYLYTDVGKFEDPKQLFGKNIPFTTKSFIAKWDGIIKAGIDISGIELEENKGRKEILIRLPEAKILSHEIKSESIETLDEKNGLFNPIKIDDIREFDVNSKEAMEQRAIENGILEKAIENAQNTIYNLVYTDAVEKLGYSIIFEVIGDA